MITKVLLVSKFNSYELFEGCKNGSFPSQHIHAVDSLERHGIEISHLIDNKNIATVEKLIKHKFLLLFYITILTLIKLQGNDVALSFFFKDIRILAILRRFKILKKPLICFVHSLKLHNGRIALLNRLCLEGVDRLIFLNQSNLNSVCDIVNNQNTFSMEYGADLSFYPKPEKGKFKHILSVGVCGRDFETLFEAAEGCSSTFCIVGAVPSDLREAHPDNIEIIGNGNYDLSFKELLSLYNDAYFVVITTHVSTHPYGINSLVEAMAMGKAVILTESFGIDIDPESLGFGFKVPAHNPLFLLDRINYLLENPSVSELMGRRAREWIEKKYNTKEMEKLLLKVIKPFLKSLDTS